MRKYFYLNEKRENEKKRRKIPKPFPFPWDAAAVAMVEKRKNIWPQTNLWFQIEINVWELALLGPVGGWSFLLKMARKWFFQFFSCYLYSRNLFSVSSLDSQVLHSLTKHFILPLTSSSWWRPSSSPSICIQHQKGTKEYNKEWKES